jgi:MFS superfamily sulfate permease-like transporter
MDTVEASDWKTGFFEGAIPQIPLTTLNSVISVCCLAHSLYPEKRNPKAVAQNRNDAVISQRDVAISVGLMNLIMCPFGAMPNCHGAGGLAGQHRLGARHGASVVFLGVHKILLAVFFGASALTLLDALPKAILGVMLAIAGQELTTTGFLLLVSQSEEVFKRTANNGGDKKLVLRKNVVVAIITAMVIVAMGKTHYAKLSGLVAHMIYGTGTEDFIQWCRQSPRIGPTSHVLASKAHRSI